MPADDLQAKVSEVLSRYGFRGTVTGLPPNFPHRRSQFGCLCTATEGKPLRLLRIPTSLRSTP